jgi:chromosome segregation ATPase
MSEIRVDRLEAEMREIKEAVIRIEATLNATLPHLATKAELTTGLADVRIDLRTDLHRVETELRSELAALKVELADKPGKMWLTTAIGLLIAAYVAGLAGLAALPVITKVMQ